MATRNRLLTRLLGGQKLPSVSPMREMGTGGTAVYGGIVRTIERSSKWTGKQRYVTASEIATNISIVAAGVYHFLNLLAHPKWSFTPASDEDSAAIEAAEFVEEVFTSMDTPWPRIVRRAGMYRFHGFGIQEWIAKKLDDGRIGYRDVEARPQHTIERWEIDETGNLLGVWQRSPHTNQLLGIPRGKFVYLVEDTLTDSPEGLGIFRHIGDSYERLKLYLEIEARTFERDLRGIPIGRAPISLINKAVADGVIAEADADKLIQNLEDLVKTQIKKPDTAAILDSIPYESAAQDGPKVSGVPQWGIELLTGPGLGLSELAGAIDRIQREIARVIGVEHLMLGDQGGNRALSQDKSHNLYLIANSVLRDIAASFDKDLIDPLWILNGWPDETKPTCSVEDVTFRDVQQLAAVLRDMATAGAVLDPRDPVIDDVRDLMGVSRQPEVDESVLGPIGSASAAAKPPEPPPPEEEEVEEELGKYNPDQPRDPNGRWTNGPGAGDPHWSTLAPSNGATELNRNEFASIKRELRAAGILDYRDRLTLMHTTTADRVDSVLEHGLVPGAEEAPGQSFAAAHSQYATYFHLNKIGVDNTLANLNEMGILDDAGVVVAKVPFTRAFAARILPDEDVSLNPRDWLAAVREGSSVAIVGGIEPEFLYSTPHWIDLHRQGLVKYDPNQPRDPIGRWTSPDAVAEQFDTFVDQVADLVTGALTGGDKVSSGLVGQMVDQVQELGLANSAILARDLLISGVQRLIERRREFLRAARPAPVTPPDVVDSSAWTGLGKAKDRILARLEELLEALQNYDVSKFDPDQPRDERGRWSTTGGGGSHPGTGYSANAVVRNGVIYTTDVEDAVRALHENRRVELDQPRSVSTLLDRLAQEARRMEAAGEQAKNFDLCNVSVTGSNLFCTDSQGIPRIEMPQLKGVPLEGSRAAGLTPDSRGEVDVTDQFRQHLIDQGYEITDLNEGASYLRATQNELNGVKVAGIAGAIRNGTLDEQRLFVSRDNYIVDGHHRWAASVGVDFDDNRPGDVRMPVARVNVDIITLLDLSRNFAREWGIPQVAVKRWIPGLDRRIDLAVGLAIRKMIDSGGSSFVVGLDRAN